MNTLTCTIRQGDRNENAYKIAVAVATSLEKNVDVFHSSQSV